MTLFVGRVRDHDGGKGVTGLDYSAHPTALDNLREVCDRVAAEYDVQALAAVHRTGTLEIGDAAVIVATASAHRGTAFDASRVLIDTLKAEVPTEAPAVRGRHRGVGGVTLSSPCDPVRAIGSGAIGPYG